MRDKKTETHKAARPVICDGLVAAVRAVPSATWAGGDVGAVKRAVTAQFVRLADKTRLSDKVTQTCSLPLLVTRSTS